MVNQSENQSVNDSTVSAASTASPTFNSVDMTAKQDSDLVSEMRNGNSSASSCLNSLQIDMDEGGVAGGATEKQDDQGDAASLSDSDSSDLKDLAWTGFYSDPGFQSNSSRERLNDPFFHAHSGEPVNDPGFFQIRSGGPVTDPGFSHDPVSGWNSDAGRWSSTGNDVNDPGHWIAGGNVLNDPGHWTSGGAKVNDPGHSIAGGSDVNDPGHWRSIGDAPGRGHPGNRSERPIRAADLVDESSLRSIAYDIPTSDGRSMRSIATNIPASDAHAVGPSKARAVPGNNNLRPGAGGDNNDRQPSPQPTQPDDRGSTTEPAPTKRTSPVTISPVEPGRRPRGVSPMKP